jgi:hypothetical protein
MTRSEVFQLNAALAKESKSAGKMQTSAKLTLNAQQLTASPIAVPAGYDDRKDVLHVARFLGGASCSAQALWLRARDVLGPNGVTPLGKFLIATSRSNIISNQKIIGSTNCNYKYTMKQNVIFMFKISSSLRM